MRFNSGVTWALFWVVRLGEVQDPMTLPTKPETLSPCTHGKGIYGQQGQLMCGYGDKELSGMGFQCRVVSGFRV